MPFALKAQNNITFSYALKKDSQDSTLINVEAILNNNSDEDFFFLSESCNNLDYYLSTNSKNASIYIFIHCNATYPQKIKINANDDYHFTTKLKINGEADGLELSLKLYQLSSDLNVEEHSFEEIKKDFSLRTLMLKGHNKNPNRKF